MGDDRSNRTALGDITNRTAKRDFSLISPCPNSPSKTRNQNKRAASAGVNSDDDAFWKQVAFHLDKLRYETCGIPSCPNYTPDTHLSPVKHKDSNDPFWKEFALRIKELKMQPCGSDECPKVVDEIAWKGAKVPHPSSKTVSLVGNTPTDVRNSEHEVKEPSSPALDRADLGEGQVLSNVVNADDSTLQPSDVKFSANEKSETSERNCLGGERQVFLDVVNVDDITLQTSDPKFSANEKSKICEMNCFASEKASQCEKTRALPDVVVIDDTKDDLVDEVVKDDGKTLCVDYLGSNKLESAVSSKLSDSLGRKSFELERCTGLRRDGSYGSATDLDLPNSCSCSFCTKAAYIWSDLHYQDVKGRISLLMKSKKEASNLAQRYSSENTMGSHHLRNSNKATDLEIDLMSQWKSLFLHMESTLADESSQLQTNFLALKDLRDDFKTDIESINGMPSYVQPCSSEAS